MIERRVEHLREVGSILLERWDGWMGNMLQSCGRGAGRFRQVGLAGLVWARRYRGRRLGAPRVLGGPSAAAHGER